MASTGAKTRAVAAEAVDAVVTHGKSLDAAIADHEQRVAPDDRALLRMLCYGTLRRHWQLQDWIARLLQRPLKRRDSVINSLLAVGLLQISDTRIPDHAAVSQTVEATRVLRRPKLAGLVNACLRRFQRENVAADSPAGDEARWNHPQWLIEQTQRDWPDDWQDVLTANNERAPLWLRVNAAMSTVDDYRQELAAGDMEAHGIDGLPHALRLAQPCSVEALPGFTAGRVSIQDGAAQLAAEWLLNGPACERVLDACAAPGGKSGHLLEKGGSSLHLTALDNDASRVVSIAENLARLGHNATIVTADASKPEEWWDGRPFDGILLDAPCSATGVIRRHPDIKLLRRANDIQSLARLQRDLLEALWSVLAANGRLLYATCSTLAAENDGVVRGFLQTHDDAQEIDVLPNNNIRVLMRRKACGYQILPGTAQLDGFYYACLEKKAS